ncbi:MAG: hypothetical protein FJZ87_17125 [Chloroflexi bacterium]|nr:hypothetical protein [Chloroflexota bacterium]
MRVINAIIAIAFGILILAGYFFQLAAGLQAVLLEFAIILAGAAALVGVFNILFVHADKIRRREKGSIYSAALITFLVATLIFGVIVPPQHRLMQLLVDAVLLPVEAALMGVLTITLLYAAVRLLRRRLDVMSMVFLLTAVLVVFGSATLPFGNMPLFSNLRTWVSQVLALGGARGILIGVALGTLTTGLRVLFGMDRPYGGN